MLCSHCGKEIRDGERTCSYCGEPVDLLDRREEEEEKKEMKRLILLGAGIFALSLVVGGITMRLLGGSHEKSEEILVETAAEESVAETTAESAEESLVETTEATSKVKDLTELEPYYYTGSIRECSMITDTLGNVYSTGLYSLDYGASDPGVIIYEIGEAYSTLTGTIVIREEDKGDSYMASVRIYGDDELLYDKSDIQSMMKPLDFEIDVTGVEDLKIEMYGETLHAVAPCVCDIMLHE